VAYLIVTDLSGTTQEVTGWLAEIRTYYLRNGTLWANLLRINILFLFLEAVLRTKPLQLTRVARRSSQLHEPTAWCSIMQTLTKYEDYCFTVCDVIKYSTVFLNLYDLVVWVGREVSIIIIKTFLHSWKPISFLCGTFSIDISYKRSSKLQLLQYLSS
jgi:hypothetical protein